MQTRRVLVSLLRRVEATATSTVFDRPEPILLDFSDQLDSDTLRNEDPANLVALNKPTALFLISRDRMSYCVAYPFTFLRAPQ